MNSEHRHQLKQNDLATGIADLPGFFKKHGSKFILVLAFALLAVAVVRYRNNRAIEQQQIVRSSLATANNAIAQLQRAEQAYAQQQMQIAQFRGSPVWATLGDAERQQLLGGQKPEVLLAARTQAENEVRAGVQSVIDGADASRDEALLAGAWEAQGELYWQLATALPVAVAPSTQPATTQTATASLALPAATQPAAAVKSPSEYLTLSKQAYEHVVGSYPKQSRAVATARLSLAAIAESQNDFASARTQYQAVIDAQDTPTMEKAIAASRVAQVDDLAEPMLMLMADPKPEPLTPSTQPAALPSPLGPNLPMMPSLGTPAATQPTR